ncbi:uncharacterized protein LOC123511998 isoform X2 [Portunus trituberculatus]|nr:uncharacterized protein LOC123511998 isoform X2 [Portunus trituberculatus]
MNTILPLLILGLGSVLHLTHSQSCSDSETLASNDTKTISTTEIVDDYGTRMSIEVDKLYPCEDFQAVILETEYTNGEVETVSFPANGKCWEKKTNGKKLKGEVVITANYFNFSIIVDGCLINVTKKKKITELTRFTIVGNGHSHWCLGMKDPPDDQEPQSKLFTCDRTPMISHTSSSGSSVNALLVVGWVMGGLLVVGTVVVIFLVVWCVCRRSPPSPVVQWRRTMGEQPVLYSHSSENNHEESAAAASPEACVHIPNCLYEPSSALTASSGHSDTG